MQSVMMNEIPATLPAWLDYLENRHREPIQLGLERVRGVAVLLNLLSLKSVIVLVGGTNGKGSTVAALDQIYTTAGYRVGRYTSPHLLRFNERICLNQQEVSDKILCEAFSTLHRLPESLMLTYFEMTTLAALLIFKAYQPDVIILEVGMGGRLDATNIVEPDLSIITTIDLDHQAWLGNTKEAIGLEKAGILRTDKPAIYADVNPPESIINVTKKQQVPLISLKQDYAFEENENHFTLTINRHTFVLPRPSLHLNAAAAALVASYVLKNKLPVTQKDWIKSMHCVKIHCRNELYKGAVETLFDVAHNPQAVELLAANIRKRKKNGKVHAVFSGLKDKDLSGLIKPMLNLVDVWYPALLTGSRAAREIDLQRAFCNAEIPISGIFKDPNKAYEAATYVAKEQDLVIVYGSFLTVGAVFASINRCGGTNETHENAT